MGLGLVFDFLGLVVVGFSFCVWVRVVLLEVAVLRRLGLLEEVEKLALMAKLGVAQ